MEDAKGCHVCRSRYRQHIRPGSADSYVLVDHEFAARQANRASNCECDCVTVVCVGERLPQRAGAAVICIDHNRSTWLHLKGTDIDAAVHHSIKARPALVEERRRSEVRVTCIDSRAIWQQGMGERWS